MCAVASVQYIFTWIFTYYGDVKEDEDAESDESVVMPEYKSKMEKTRVPG